MNTYFYGLIFAIITFITGCASSGPKTSSRWVEDQGTNSIRTATQAAAKAKAEKPTTFWSQFWGPSPGMLNDAINASKLPPHLVRNSSGSLDLSAINGDYHRSYYQGSEVRAVKYWDPESGPREEVDGSSRVNFEESFTPDRRWRYFKTR